MSEREGHLAWCRTRALEYLDRGEPDQAFASFASDLGKMPQGADKFMPDGSLRGRPSAASFSQDEFPVLLTAISTGDMTRLREAIEGFQ